MLRSSHLPNSQCNIVTLIIALLLSGLIIDLGGGPSHERTGFRVRRLVSSTRLAKLTKRWYEPVLETSRRFQSCRSREQYQHGPLLGICVCDHSSFFLVPGSGACRHVSTDAYSMQFVPICVVLRQKQKILARTSPKPCVVSFTGLQYST